MVDGQRLTFRLAGINNQNFIMRDEETGSWWQQVSGEAIQGPLKGKKLEAVPWDEVSFAVWTGEHPDSLVLLPDAEYQARYPEEHWDKQMEQVPVPEPLTGDRRLNPRELVVGIAAGSAAKAYPLRLLAEQSPVNDTIGGVPVALVVGADGRSVRCFERTVDGEVLELFLKPDAESFTLLDAQTGSEWDFSGQGVSGPLAGRRLKRVQTLKDYWFDWKNYNRNTRVYAAGQLGPAR